MPPDPWRTRARRQVGAQLLDGSRTAYEVSASTGLDRSNAGRLLRALRDENAVIEEAPASGQARYALAEGSAQTLLDAISGAQPAGQLVAGQRIVSASVTPDLIGAFADALRARATTASVVWAAVAEGSSQYLLVFDRDAAALDSRKVVRRLEASGVRCTHVVVEEALPVGAFQRHLASLRHD